MSQTGTGQKDVDKKSSWGMYKVIFVLCFKKKKKKDHNIPVVWMWTKIYPYSQILWSLKANNSWRTLNVNNWFYAELHYWCIEGTEEHTFIFTDYEPGIYIYHTGSKAWGDYCGGQTHTWITLGCFFLKNDPLLC